METERSSVTDILMDSALDGVGKIISKVFCDSLFKSSLRAPIKTMLDLTEMKSTRNSSHNFFYIA